MNAILFDLDGVICSTDVLHYRAWKAIADEHGIYFDEAINARLRGVSRMESLAIVLERYEGDLSALDLAAMAEKKNGLYRTLLSTMTPADVDPAVLKTLRELRHRGYKLAIGSSSKNAGFILERIALRDAFDAVSDGNNIAKSKPDPEVFLKAAAMLNERAEDCLVVEDAEAGLVAAHLGGMKAAGIGLAAASKTADFRLRCLDELLTLLP